ncbi:MAG: hypothetical protein IPL08_04055 [Saprospiraceae bacterium]|nr:hypothetical protein [Saprospiraceae bacterium]MBK8669273.1 hypothetical protein [Saprospiraceae bacterium]
MNDSFQLIYNDLNIDHVPNNVGDAQILDIIADRVEWFLANDKDLLLSYLYRLDVEEKKIDIALTPLGDDAPHIALAKLIMERQKQRILSKQKYSVEPIEGWEF